MWRKRERDAVGEKVVTIFSTLPNRPTHPHLSIPANNLALCVRETTADIP